jgi:hypothetical protein
MDRINDILNEVAQAAGERYGGKKRSDLKDSDFLFPQTRSFPIVTPADIPDAISNFGRMKGQMSYDAFLKKLYNMAKRKGPEFVAALPKATKDKLGIKKSQAQESEEETPETELMEYKEDFFEMSVGSLRAIAQHSQNILNSLNNPIVKNNLTESWLQGKIAITEDYMRTIHDFIMYVTEANSKAYTGNTDTDMMTDPSYTNFYELDRVSMASLKKGDRVKNINSSCKHYGSEGYVEDIEELPDYMGDVVIYKASNSGETWKTGDLLKKTRNQLAIVKEKRGLTSGGSHDNLKSQNQKDDNTLSSQQEKTPDEENTEYLDEFTPSNSGDKPGLWDNIRKKKEKMGKNYRPAKPGDKDRPDPQQWKKLTK